LAQPRAGAYVRQPSLKPARACSNCHGLAAAARRDGQSGRRGVGLGVGRAASRRGKGILYLTPHLGCFEVTAQYLSTHAPITVLYRPPKQAWLQTMIEAGRARAQLHLAAADLSGVRGLLKALKRGEAVGMLPDQAPRAGEGRWLDFFGRPAYTMTLAARLVETGASVIMVWAERLPAGAGYHFHLQAPTQPISGSIEERALQINQQIEVLVRQCPQQYLWGYNRYKRRRSSEAPPLGGSRRRSGT
jgi:KDO2-lipid IV(A) lauroyltransferase